MSNIANQNAAYQLPQIEQEETGYIGKYGLIRKRYLEEHQPIAYTTMILDGSLWAHLEDMNHEAQEQIDRILESMKQAGGVTEELKAKDPMGWVGQVNNLLQAAEETVLRELVYCAR